MNDLKCALLGRSRNSLQSRSVNDRQINQLRPLKRLSLAGFCLSAALAAGSPARAAIVTYDVDGLIAGGGTLTGTFSLDQSTFAITALSLVATAGVGYYGQTFGLGDQQNGFTTANDLNVPNGPVLGEFEALSSQFSGGAEIHITFPYPSGGAIETTTLSTFGESYYVISGSQMREAVSGTVTLGTGVSGVPLPSAAPMFGAALLALGTLGYGLKRKTKAAV